MKRDWMTGLVLLAVAVALAAAASNSRADDPWPYTEDVAAESLTTDPAAQDDALYGDAYEEDSDGWTDYASEGYDYEGYDYDEAHSANYDTTSDEVDRGWGASCERLAECFRALGRRATSLLEQWCANPESPSLAIAQRITGAALLPALPWLADAGWLPASASDPLADEAVEPMFDPYDGSPEQLTDLSDDSWTDVEYSMEEEADSDPTPVVDEAIAADSVVETTPLPGPVESSWGNRAGTMGRPSEMEPLQ